MSRPFIHDNFLLQTKTAHRLYHEVAAPLPIIDYHCHLPPGDISSDRRFANLFEIWLEGDHYKWRAMRANGISERFCTGDADPYEKFASWCATVPHTLRNPLYPKFRIRQAKSGRNHRFSPFGSTQLTGKQRMHFSWAFCSA